MLVTDRERGMNPATKKPKRYSCIIPCAIILNMLIING